MTGRVADTFARDLQQLQGLIRGERILNGSINVQ
jgi:hypothetical protein